MVPMLAMDLTGPETSQQNLETIDGTQLRREWGGVVPTLAMEAHAAAIDSTLEAALAEAGVTPAQLAAVAVTVGPGLSMCLQASASADIFALSSSES